MKMEWVFYLIDLLRINEYCLFNFNNYLRMAEEISGWLQDIDPMEVQNRETNPKSQTVRSYSLC